MKRALQPIVYLMYLLMFAVGAVHVVDPYSVEEGKTIAASNACVDGAQNVRGHAKFNHSLPRSRFAGRSDGDEVEPFAEESRTPCDAGSSTEQNALAGCLWYCHEPR